MHLRSAPGTEQARGLVIPWRSRRLETFSDLSRSLEYDDRLVVGSVKTNLGHLEGACALSGILKVVAALEQGQIPPTLDFQKPNPRIDFQKGRLSRGPETPSSGRVSHLPASVVPTDTASLTTSTTCFHLMPSLELFQYLAANTASMVWLTSCGLVKGRNPDGSFVPGLLRTLGTDSPAGQFLSVNIDAKLPRMTTMSCRCRRAVLVLFVQPSRLLAFSPPFTSGHTPSSGSLCRKIGLRSSWRLSVCTGRTWVSVPVDLIRITSRTSSSVLSLAQDLLSAISILVTGSMAYFRMSVK